MLRPTRVFSSLALVLAGALAVAPARAFAEPGDGAEPSRAARAAELNEAGARLYRARDYRQAIEKFIEAYAIDRDANLLFNIARCYEELGDNAAAIEKYTAYVNAPGADAAGRVRAEQSLRALRELRAAKKSAATPPPAKSAKPADGPESETQPAAPADGSSVHRTLAWGALGTGALLAGLGATVYYLGMQDHDRVTGSPGYGNPNAVNPMTLPEAQALVDAGDWKKRAGGIGLGVGGALIATSIALFVWSGDGEGQSSTGTLAVGWDPGAGPRAAWTVRF